jgi:phenylacetate-CoA ligase
MDRQQWSHPEEIEQFQWRELKRLLLHAYERVPFHRRRFEKLGIHPEDIRRIGDYSHLPFMEKRDFREAERELLSELADPRKLFTNGSGGSTGEPMRYKHDRDSYEWRQAAHLRGNAWAGSALGRKEFHLWGEPMVRDSILKAAKRALHHRALNHRYANSYRMTEGELERYLGEFNRFRPDVLIGYSYSLYLFARYADASAHEVWSPRGIIGTAEKLLPHQRELIQAVFRAPVYDRYGCREVMLIGMECEEHRGLHLTADNLYVEILREDGRPAGPGEEGEVVVTDLHNYAMPFLRYRIGDLAVASDRRCRCGRGLPLIEEVRGRTLDVLRTPEGRRISGVFVPMFFKDYAWVDEFQVEQPRLDRIDVRIKPREDFRAPLLDALRADLQDRLGPSVELEVRIVEEIPRTPSGKHRPVISHLPPEEALDATPAA